MSKLESFKAEPPKKPQKCRSQKKLNLGVPEPKRISIYDQMRINFKIAKRKTFLHRMMYIGTFRATLEEKCVLDFFKTCVSAINKSKPFETVCGFLLLYPQYFVHLIEGDEDSVYNHLGFVLHHIDFDKFFPNVKVLVDLTDLNDKICIDWSHYSSIPNTLLAPIDINTDIQSTAYHICRCYGLVCDLINTINHHSEIPKIISRNTSPYKPSVINVNENLHKTSLINSQKSENTLYRSGSRLGSVLFRTACPYKNLLPEAELLDFLLETTNTMKLEDVVDIYGKTPQRNIYKDRVWPIPQSYTPYDLFDTVYDRNVELFPKVTNDYDNQK